MADHVDRTARPRPRRHRPAGRGRVPSPGEIRRRYSLLTRRDKLVLGAHGRHPPVLRPRPHLGPDDRLDLPVVHELERHRQPVRRQGHRPQELREPVHARTRSSGRPSSTTSSGWAGSCSSRRRSGCSSRSCSTGRSAGRASTRRSSTSRSSCRSRSSASSGSSSTPPSRASSTTSSAGPPNDNLIDWLGNPNLNLWAALVATSWRHVGYIMVLYLAGLKAFDPTLREAAKVDGASERQTFFRVVFPVMMPINVVIVVITTIEALRAFDIAYIINRGKNGLELLSTLITNNAISESNRARVRLGHRRRPAGRSRSCRSSTFLTRMLARRRRHDARRRQPRPAAAVVAPAQAPPAAGRPVRLPHGHGRRSGCSRSRGASTPRSGRSPTRSTTATSRRRRRSTSTTSSTPGTRASSQLHYLSTLIVADPGGHPDPAHRVDGGVRRLALQLALQPAAC